MSVAKSIHIQINDNVRDLSLINASKVKGEHFYVENRDLFNSNNVFTIMKCKSKLHATNTTVK